MPTLLKQKSFIEYYLLKKAINLLEKAKQKTVLSTNVSAFLTSDELIFICY
ncbi:hypothetical protein FD11_GL001395 [Ligilactobacillus pobuzihii E100301 = KCTC 13174]|uniref:Uncharacterized protein n=1 Tax=Ligilactobacillus pobuzihii TaxID=449659 RepID=A0A0R2LBJ1_9LACO|nr:hypothetical protein FD11_GL001395 [Ligilactobacillus pobuzihii E100301 = KCTC 13174]KRN95796.1 hypothetical protein IV66_GL000815 [Ligilactobacillus pobuzihii]